MLNFTDKNARVNTGMDLSGAELVQRNYITSVDKEKLKSYDARIYKL